MSKSDLFLGKQIGNYRLIAKIDSGRFGSVYQGKHTIFENDRIVAIKLLHATLRSPQEYASFFKEAQMLEKLQHPHILHVLDAGQQDDIPYLITEYAAGGSLRDRLLKYNNQPIHLDEAVTILTQIGKALHYAHQHKIVHRDLKPANILFNNQGDALIADFGIAVILATTHTGQFDRSGTPPYMAPEQFEGWASAKSDQYALGCIAYELFTGYKLYNLPNPSPEAFWYHHAKVEPRPLRHYNPQLSVHIEQAILKALSKNRNNRYDNVLDFSDALLKSNQGGTNEGDVHYHTKHLEATSADLLIQLDPDNASALNSRGNSFKHLGQYQEALEAYEEAIRLDPNLAYAYNGRGNALFYLKRYTEALEAYEEALHLDPNFVDAYNGKGNTLSSLNRPYEALTAFNQAIALAPNHAMIYYNIGLTLYDLKRYEEALTAFQQVIHFNPNDTLAYYNKGLVLQKLRKRKEAQQAFEKARQLGYTD